MRKAAAFVGLVSALAIGCTSTPPVGVNKSAVTTCTCDGTGPGYVPITVNCGQNACGSDDNTWSCSASGWSYAFNGCGSTPDMTQASSDGGCSCNGTGPGDVPLTVSCGQLACGSDNNTWSCSAGGWSYASDGCNIADMATPPCTCNGTGPGDVPITVNCGQIACGSDDNSWSCSANGWSYAHDGCAGGGADMTTASKDMAAGSCTCNGTGPGDVPLTVSCGQTACGSDNNTWSCSASGWSYGHDGCTAGADMATTSCDMATGPCSCDGTGPGDVPITVSCGQTACGSDNNTWSCSASGWSYGWDGCTASAPDMGCGCDGTGPDYQRIHVSCGQSACGSDDNTWSCSASGWAFASFGCAG